MKEAHEILSYVFMWIMQLTISIGCIVGISYLIKNWKNIWK